MNNLKQDIINKSIQLDIDLIGFCNNDFNDLYKILKRQQELNLKSNLQKSDINNYKPENLLKSVNTIIGVGLSYSSNRKIIKNIKKNEVYFCSSSFGIDYHKILKGKLEELCQYIKTKVDNFEYKICIDTSIIDDRYVSYKSGIGFYGKNGLIINPKYGSYIYLGSVLTNLDLEKDEPLNNSCLGCNKCINSCPNKSINNSGILDYKNCLSYITQKKEELSIKEIENMNQCIFGCDICQEVCPHNKINYHNHECFSYSGVEIIDVDEYISLSNKEFRKKYGHLSGSFRGKKIIERNIDIYREKKDGTNIQ